MRDIIENIDAIRSHIGRYGVDEFSSDRKTVDATERCLEPVAEAVVKIGADRMAVIAPGLPVERVRGLGNLLRHAYDIVDLGQLYILIGKDLPPLRAAAVAALAR